MYIYIIYHTTEMFRNDYSQKSQKQQLVTIFHHVQRCFQAQVSTTLDEAHLFYKCCMSLKKLMQHHFH